MKILYLSLLLATTVLTAESEKRMPELTVKGTGVALKLADQVEISLAVVTQDADPQKAVQVNNGKIEGVIQQLKGLGLNGEELKTSQYTTQPIYRYPDPKEKDTTPTITHYEVTHLLQVKSRQLALAQKILGAAIQAGVNRLDQIAFTLSDPQAARKEAIQLAAQRAIEDAKVLSQAAEVKLIGILSLDLDPNPNYYPTPRLMMAKAENAGSFDVPLEIGQVETQATVQIVFEIESKG
ncbi:MAG: SIMPL domain-containing protein [Parachlamydia sp.]|jgi:hypothetical protein|nr:SIMPL domain-containing protein [Parachlamydia sp.]